MAYALVQPGRALCERQLPRPDMGLGVAVELEVALGDLRDRIGRWGLNPVHLTREQGGRAGVGLWHRQHHYAINFRRAFGIPVGFVGNDFETLASHELRHLEGPGARRIRGECDPCSFGTLGRRTDGGRNGLIECIPMGR